MGRIKARQVYYIYMIIQCQILNGQNQGKVGILYMIIQCQILDGQNQGQVDILYMIVQCQILDGQNQGKVGILYMHTCDRVAMLQLEICKFLAGDLVS